MVAGYRINRKNFDEILDLRCMSKFFLLPLLFREKNSLPIEQLQAAGIEYFINPLGHNFKEEELVRIVSDFNTLIAGTEQITDMVMGAASKLKLISKVGIGLDNVDLLAVERGVIKVNYTPDVPASAVAELTIELMFSLLRSVHIVNIQMYRGEWHRHKFLTYLVFEKSLEGAIRDSFA